MKRTHFIVTLMLLLAQACTPATPTPSPVTPVPPTAAEAPEDTAALLERLGGVPCPESDFTCVTLVVPFDHFAVDRPRTLEVVFAVLPATGERKGMFVTATGGPGTAGLGAADEYTAAFDPSIPEHFDIVFFDQRGVGQSGGLQCIQAAATFYRADWDASTPSGEADLLASARTFADDCVAEMGTPDSLSFLGTAQAVEDLEMFREAIGAEEIWLYGESYGTQYAQAYTAAHPDRVAGLILDGTVDLTLSGPEFLDQQARAFENTLRLTLEACNADELCAESIGGGDAVSAYDRLAQRLKAGPADFDFPLPSSGTLQRRTFSYSDLETAISGFLYSEGARMVFLRALAAYSRNEDLVPMARLLYSSLVIDPETLEPVLDPTYSDAIYYAVECQDYGYFDGPPEQRAEAYLRAGDGIDASLPAFSSVFYGDLPCAFWPETRTDSSRPAPLAAEGIPTLVLGALADPATPVSNGQAVFSRLSDGYLVTQEGGPHVIFGRGEPCIDDLVTAFLVEGRAPAARETVCEGVVAWEFVPLAPLDAAQFGDLLEAFYSVDNEIYYLPEYYYWDVVTPTALGCPFGGTLSFEPTQAGDRLTLTDCAFSQGFVMAGTGENNYDEGTFTLNVAVTGLQDGELIYARDGEGRLSVTGTYGGEEIELSE